MDLDILNNLIEGRVTPHIYAFSTNTVPNYLKIGDTYRPVSVRLTEWKNRFQDLEEKFQKKATINNEVFFRDYAVHSYLETELNKYRLTKNDIGEIYFSNEFFKDTSPKDIENAIEDIEKNYDENSKYQYYYLEAKKKIRSKYKNTKTINPRKNQQETIDRFTQAVNNGRTNLLMYAVMRFGKSFTALCCAVENNYKLVVVVSAKADVKEEWKETVESITRFSQYCFLDEKDLTQERTIISSILRSKNEKNKVVIFLTLQDLQGEKKKEKHEELFNLPIDLLIVDETHFGARAEKYGEVLKKSEQKKENEDYITIEEAEKRIKAFDANVTLHLSGTPYRILMACEFQKEDIIAFYQFSDIIHEKEKWDKDNILDDKKKEWDNPYYGFPQMIRFAFNPNESSRKKIEQLKKEGISYAFAELFKTKSLDYSATNEHKFFKHEKEVLDLFQCIDGSKDDDNLLGFLDYDKLKEGKMCRHIVVVLPYRASCDATQDLLSKHRNTFKNIKEYEIINISGISNSYKNAKSVKEKIKKCESNDTKTITLTVNRMLTGSTVPEWDTMLYFKDTASPQEYDQAIFRLQNQYIKEYFNEEGDVIKYNMKPQTLLVDFDPNRMFYMQEQKSLIYNTNIATTGNNQLEERIKEELRISPIITINAKKMQQVEATDILNAISDYSKNKGVAEEVIEIPVDLALLNHSEIKRVIEAENELGSKDGLTISATKSEDGSEIDIPDDFGETENTNEIKVTEENKEEIKENNIAKQFRTYYARILFYSFLTKNKVKSLYDIIATSADPENSRILYNLGLKISILKLFKKHMDAFTLNILDYKIQNINNLSHDSSLTGVEKCRIGINKFGKLGKSEVVTPIKICNEMVSLIPNNDFKKVIERSNKVLDIAGKVGEFAIALSDKFISIGYTISDIKDIIYTIPTSSASYEFTRKTYENLGLNVDNIAEKFNTYDLLNVKKNQKNKTIDFDKVSKLLSQTRTFNTITLKDEVKEGENTVKFDIILGNPPYMEMDGGAKASAKPIYHFFVEQAKKLNPLFLTMIIPARWYAGGKGLDEFRKNMLKDSKIKALHDYPLASDCFPGVRIAGGVCYFLQSQNQCGDCTVFTHAKDSVMSTMKRPLLEKNADTFIRINEAITILRKVQMFNEKSFSSIVSSRKPYGLASDFFESQTKYGLPELTEIINKKNFIKIYGNLKYKKTIKYVDEAYPLPSGKDSIYKYKIFISQVLDNGFDWTKERLRPFLGNPREICTETYLIIGNFETKQHAMNAISYINTKFFHLLMFLKKVSHHVTAKVYSFVPMQDFNEEWSDEKLYKKYGLDEKEIEFIETMIKPME